MGKAHTVAAERERAHLASLGLAFECRFKSYGSWSRLNMVVLLILLQVTELELTHLQQNEN